MPVQRTRAIDSLACGYRRAVVALDSPQRGIVVVPVGEAEQRYRCVQLLFQVFPAVGHLVLDRFGVQTLVQPLMGAAVAADRHPTGSLHRPQLIPVHQRRRLIGQRVPPADCFKGFEQLRFRVGF